MKNGLNVGSVTSGTVDNIITFMITIITGGGPPGLQSCLVALADLDVSANPGIFETGTGYAFANQTVQKSK